MIEQPDEPAGDDRRDDQPDDDEQHDEPWARGELRGRWAGWEGRDGS